MPAPDRYDGPRWLDICRHRIRGEPTPYILVIQHHVVPAASRIVAPLMPAGAGAATLLAPHVQVDRASYYALLLEMASVPLRLIAEAVGSAEVHADAIGNALDAIFRGYPVGLPI